MRNTSIETMIEDRESKIAKRSYFSILSLRSSILGLLMLAGTCSCNSSPATSQQPPGPPVALVAANRALEGGRSDEAIADAGSYLRTNPYGPDSAEAFYLQGRGYEQKVSGNPTEMGGNLAQARDAYQLALGRGPAGPLEGNIRASLSNVTFFQDDFAAAIDQATQAMRLVDSPQVKSFLLFRIGVCQQRLGEWTNADQTFNQVIQRYPGATVAQAARDHSGQHQFYVQLATFKTPQDAEKDLARLSGTNAIITRRTDARGQTVADLGPFSTYPDAKRAKDQLGGGFPDALIVP